MVEAPSAVKEPRPRRFGKAGVGTYRQGFSRRHCFAHASTSRRFHRAWTLDADRLGESILAHDLGGDLMVTPRMSAISTTRTVLGFGIHPTLRSAAVPTQVR